MITCHSRSHCSPQPTWRAPRRLVRLLHSRRPQCRLELNLALQHCAAGGHPGWPAAAATAGHAAALGGLHADAGARHLLRPPQLAVLLQGRRLGLPMLRCVVVPPTARLLILIRVPPRQRGSATAAIWAWWGGDPRLLSRHGRHSIDHAGGLVCRAAAAAAATAPCWPGSRRRHWPCAPLLANNQPLQPLLQCSLLGCRPLLICVLWLRRQRAVKPLVPPAIKVKERSTALRRNVNKARLALVHGLSAAEPSKLHKAWQQAAQGMAATCTRHDSKLHKAWPPHHTLAFKSQTAPPALT